jgi:hypothetical protein
MNDHIESSEYEIVQDAQHAVSEVDKLVSRIPSYRLREILGSNPARAEELRGVLTEVGNTYKTIYDAITDFISPGVSPVPIDPRPFVTMDGGFLTTEIERGIGRCDRISDYYYGDPGTSGEGGLRHWIQGSGKLSNEEMVEADYAFDRLSNADYDLFRPIGEVGKVLTKQSGVIVDLLSRQQEDTARRHVRKLRDEMLKPLQTELSNAMQNLQRQQRHIGIA